MTILDQISVFVENKPGALSEITASLAEADINLKAFTIADKSEFGVLRFLSDSPTQALALLKRNGWVASKTPVISVKMANKPGSLAKILKIFADADVQVEYMYAFLAQEEGQAYVVFRVEEPETAIKLLAAADVQ
jgi:hypothetical protein